jgi:ABC-2 type transport system permease protein
MVMRNVHLRGGWALIKSTWLSWMQYRGFFFLLAFGWMIPPLIYLFVWSTAAASQPVGGITRSEFVAYYLALIIVNQLTYSQTNWTVGDVIRYGDLNPWLLRPMLPLFHAISSEIAGKVVYMSFVIPVVAVLSVVLRPSWSISPESVIAFVPALVFAWALRFFWGYWLALLAFWATRADALLAAQDALVFLLGGQVAPTALLPGAMRALAAFLPFRYMLGFPVEVLTGQLDRHGLLMGFAVQGAWLTFALLLSGLMWHKGLRRYTAVGG